MPKKKPKIELPQLKHKKSGLRKRGRYYFVLYYVDGKLKTWGTGETNLPRAISQRDWFHKRRLDEGATYKGGKSPALSAAKADPNGMDCIYETTTYKVVVEGEHVITTTNKQKAIDSRNDYIKQNH